ncbi:putative glycolipid-binding domain-containing protein [Brevibacterium metallidurans]|uniref:N-acetyltransferase domain-containing protein n=1 Tax=Brevibacterium metallidurans TaxID=1482676 RepID=A0ABP3C9S5_9MICO
MASHVAPPPEYVSDRLILRRFDDDDVEFVLGLHAHPGIARFIPSAVMSGTEDAQVWIAAAQKMSGHARGRWCVTLHDGTPIGAVIAKPIPYSAGESGEEVEIGWRFHLDFGGRGYATEAGELILAACLASGLDRVIAVVDAENVASQAVCRRIGMTALGGTTKYYDQPLLAFEAGAAGARSRQVSWVGVDDPVRRDSADVLLDDGLRAFGRQVTDDYAAAWTVDARDGWITRTVAVAVQGRGWARTLILNRDSDTGRWTSATHERGAPPTSLPRPGIVDADALDEALDCDLGMCPLTNTMPIRRLGVQTDTAAEHSLTMAWIDMPSLEVIAGPQIYTGIDADYVRYTSGTRDFTAELTVDEDGLVIDYPQLAERTAVDRPV